MANTQTQRKMIVATSFALWLVTARSTLEICVSLFLFPGSQVTSYAVLPCHARSRGTHALTFRQYSSYSVPNIFRSVGSSYTRTNRATPRTTARAAEISAQFAWPKTTHSPAHPQKNPSTSDSARIDRTPPRRVSLGEPPVRVFRGLSIQSPTRIAAPR